MEYLKQDLKRLFDITDLGEPNKLVGIEFTRDRERGTLTIRQTKYIESILEKYGMQDANPVSTPLDPNVKLEPREKSAEPQPHGSNYTSLTGSLMYATIGTRPDIAYAVNKLCSFNSNPDLAHWAAAKRVLRYLKGTKELGITYTKNRDHEFYGYADASFAGNSDLTSTSGSAFILNGGAITWTSKKEATPALSTAEAEFTSMARAGKEIIWLRNLYTEIGYEPKNATILYGDNKSAIAIATNAQFHKRSKYFDLQNLYIRKKIKIGWITLVYCSTDEMTADILTKALQRGKHVQHSKGLGLR